MALLKCQKWFQPQLPGRLNKKAWFFRAIRSWSAVKNGSVHPCAEQRLKPGPDKKRDNTAHLTPALLFGTKSPPSGWRVNRCLPAGLRLARWKGAFACRLFWSGNNLMVVKHSGDQKRHREMWKRHGEEVVRRQCEVRTAGSRAGVGGVGGVAAFRRYRSGHATWHAVPWAWMSCTAD